MRSRVREAEALLDPGGLGAFTVAEWIAPDPAIPDMPDWRLRASSFDAKGGHSLEQDGGASEPQQPTPESEDPDGSPPAESPPPAATADRPRRLLIAGGIIAAVGVVAAIGFTVGGGDLTAPPTDDDDDLGITLPTGDAAS